MRIYYTNKKIFWNNETSDFLEKEKFDEYLGDDVWIEIRSNKSINWSSHYSASFYATDNFDATYFKVVKSNQTYYFFVDDIVFDSSSGKEYSLSLDLYNTYSIHLIEKLKQENPNVYFTRKHTNRYWKKDGDIVMNYLKQPWCFQLPQYLQDVEKSLYPLNSKPIECKQYNKSPEWIGGTAHGTIDDKEFTNVGNYVYLRMKIGTKVKTHYKLSPVVYYPIRYISAVFAGANTYTKALTYPADYVIDMVSLPIPPSSFRFATKIKEFYSGAAFDNDDSVVFYNILGGVIGGDLLEEVSFININNDEYNINYIDNEVMLYSPQCKKISVMDKELTLPYYFYNDFQKIGYKKINEIGFSRISCAPLATFYFRVTDDLDLHTYLFTPSQFMTGDFKIPIIGNVYTSYLQNNGTSMSTEISLANERKNIEKQNIDAQMGMGMFSGALSGLLGGLTAGLTGGKLGLDAVGSGVSQVIGSAVDASYQTSINEFNVKQITSKQEALKSDLRNQVGDLKDLYGKGQLQDVWYVFFSELPQNEKLRVFTDIYFNGYITNTIFKFNDYDNRINFNYFELKNVFALCSQYLKLPKSIMTSIAKQLESGIRLWKTPNFDYTLTLDNREKSYEIN